MKTSTNTKGAKKLKWKLLERNNWKCGKHWEIVKWDKKYDLMWYGETIQYFKKFSTAKKVAQLIHNS